MSNLPRLLTALDGSGHLALAFDPNEARDEKGQWTDGTNHPYHVYPLQMKDSQGNTKTMYGVQSLDNFAKGTKAGFGDTVHSTENEAHKAAEFQYQKQNEREEYLKKAQDAKISEELAKKSKYDSVSSFTSGMTPHKMARVVEYLHKPIRYGNKEYTIKSLIEHSINNEGRKMSLFDGKRVLEHEDGRILTEKPLGKIGMDYASHVLGAEQQS